MPLPTAFRARMHRITRTIFTIALLIYQNTPYSLQLIMLIIIAIPKTATISIVFECESQDPLRKYQRIHHMHLQRVNSGIETKAQKRRFR